MKNHAKRKAAPRDTLVRVQEGGSMNEEQYLDWLKMVWFHHPVASLHRPSMFVIDSFCDQLTEKVKKIKDEMSNTVLIPGGMTGMLQSFTPLAF